MLLLGEETGRTDHSMFAARSSGLVRKAFKVSREAFASPSFCRLSRGPEESPKSSWEYFEGPIGDDSSMVAVGNQEGQRSLMWSGEK